MEKWTEICKGVITAGKYLVEVRNGEEKGLVVVLEGGTHSVKIDFGVILAVRRLGEGILWKGTFDELELMKYKNKFFSNTIYKIADGQFEKSVRDMSGKFYNISKFEHYLIITLNYVIEVISEWEPEVIITPLN